MGELDEKLNSLLSDPDSLSQIMQLAQQLSGGLGSQSPPPAPHPAPVKPPETIPNGPDPILTARLLPLLQEYGKPNTQAMDLLNALRPYLKAEKQEKIQRAVRLARLIHIGKRFFTDWEG